MLAFQILAHTITKLSLTRLSLLTPYTFFDADTTGTLSNKRYTEERYPYI